MYTPINAIEKCSEEMYSKINEEIECLISDAVYSKCIPLMKGNPTSGKMKWRGIFIVNKKDGNDNLIWVQQRDRRISAVLRIDYGNIFEGKINIYKSEPLSEDYINFEVKNYRRRRVHSNKFA